MKSPDIWDNAPSSERQNKRYFARWKVAIVFANATSKPVFQTLTHDLSMNGVSMQYHTTEKLNTVVGLHLAPPPIDNVAQRIIKLKAVIVSSVPFRGGFRLGMTFIEDAELEKLRASIGKYISADKESLASHPDADAFPTLNF